MLRDKPVYADRPRPYFLVELVGWRRVPNFVSVGPTHKETRRIFSRELGSNVALARFDNTIHTHCTSAMERIIGDPDPENLLKHIRL
jgi:hypothetical protein